MMRIFLYLEERGPCEGGAVRDRALILKHLRRRLQQLNLTPCILVYFHLSLSPSEILLYAEMFIFVILFTPQGKPSRAICTPVGEKE